MGTVFNIQRFCINDGPGIRTTVFLKGCPLRCKWCHNPESHVIAKELMFNSEKCVKCGACQAVCEYGVHSLVDGKHVLDREKCRHCGKCVSVCPTKALESVGCEKDVDDVIAEVMRDEVFYSTTGGGLTVSGGEPMLQYEFTLALVKKAKAKGLHVCIETCGYAEPEALLEVAKYVDIVLFDIKLTDSPLHREYTGVTTEKIHKNLHLLDGNGYKTILRCPIIPPINDNEEHFKGIADIANSLENVLGIELEPFHPLGSAKYVNLGREDMTRDFVMPEKKAVDEWVKEVQKYTAVSVKRS